MGRPKKESIEPILDKEAALNNLKLKHKDIGRKIETKPIHWSECLSTGSLQLDLITNDGGLRPGSIVEIYGKGGVMKTTLAWNFVKNAQKKWSTQRAGYYDLEGVSDLYHVENGIGVDFANEDGEPIVDYWPNYEDEIPTLEEVLARIYDCVASGLYSIIVLDSLAACMTLWDKEQKDVTSQKAFGPAIVLRNGFRKINSICHRTGTIIVICNHMTTSTVPGPRPITVLKPTGGTALEYAATHRFRLDWADKDREGDDSKLRITTDKIKYGKSWQPVEIPVELGYGFNEYADLVLAAEAHNVLTKKGSWYFLNGEQLGQGANGAVTALVNLGKIDEVREQTLNKVLPQPPTKEEVSE